MANKNYQIGGILAALNEEPDQTENEEENNLSKLFSFKSTEKEEPDIPDEEIEAFINAVEEPKEIKVKKKNLKLDETEKVKKKFDEDSPERKARTIFVGNISLTVSKKDLKKLFCKYGEIENIRIRSVPRADAKTSKKVAFIRKEYHKERDNMNAYVVFKNKEDAEKSLKSNGIVLQEKHIRVDFSENKQHDTISSLFVGNLPFNIKEDTLREHFGKCGEIEDIRVIRDKATGIGKGFAYIHFQDKGNVMFGLKMNGKQLSGRKLRVSKARNSDDVKRTGGRDASKKNFQGLRSTSQKDIKMGKKLFTDKNKPSKHSNALRRLKEKNAKSKQKKPMKAQKKREKNNKK